MMHAVRLLSLTLMLALAGCAGDTRDPDPTAGRTPEDIYQEARGYLDSGNYESAARLLSQLEARYPYGVHAQQAQLDIAYARYKNAEYGSAILAADRFIKLNPRHENVDYAYYLRGLAAFDRTSSYLQNLFRQDPAARDPKNLLEAFDYFEELTRRFPDSRYSDDASQRMLYLRNLLARHELLVADYYFRRGAHLAAANRAKAIINEFPRSEVVADALALMVRSYRTLELPELADDALRVLARNYPERAAALQAGATDAADKES